MADLIWTDEFKIGNEKVDHQHETLFQLVNEFLASIREGRARADIEKVFNVLANYTQTHFADEESLFVNTKYPFSKKHIEEHRALIQRVSELKDDYDTGKTFMSLSVFSFLREWLKHHIIETDKKITPFINE
ncbi:hemerythrin family protein [candidate division KSB1 bacterium]|nr:hemerythrin family protein [candidate division KSB1 bacterium]